MALDLANYKEQARDAIKAFWGNREAALRKQAETGNIDAGTRGAVTAGNNLNGFLALMQSLVRANGLHEAEIHVDKGLVVLPGYFRPNKQWDVVVMRGHRLVAALEFKSQVGSYGNNYNNRTEEAIGTAHCLWTAFREGALGDEPRPFLGWLMVVGDEKGSRSPRPYVRAALQGVPGVARRLIHPTLRPALPAAREGGPLRRRRPACHAAELGRNRCIRGVLCALQPGIFRDDLRCAHRGGGLSAAACAAQPLLIRKS